MEILKIVELISAGSALANRVIINLSPKSFWAWLMQMVSCIFSAYLAYSFGMFILTALETWGFFLGGTLFILKFFKVSNKVENYTQYITGFLTFLVCLFLLKKLTVDIKIITEFVCSVFFMSGMVLLIKSNKYGHLLFGIANLILSFLFLANNMKVYFVQQLISCFIVMCSFYGYRINYKKFSITKVEKTPD